MNEDKAFRIAISICVVFQICFSFVMWQIGGVDAFSVSWAAFLGGLLPAVYMNVIDWYERRS